MRTADQIYEQLCGSCEGELTDEELAHPTLPDEVDEVMFKCVVCGWWCDACEYSEKHCESGETVCCDCEDDYG